MGSSPPVDSGDHAGLRAAAERDTLLELIAVFSHDLSNPLQSITVLCELGLEALGDDGAAEQCLAAAERMRSLIHGLSGFTRGLKQPADVGRVVGRLQDLLGRRFDRHSLAATYDVDSVRAVGVPSGLEFALLALCLGIIAAASDARRPGRFAVSGRASGPDVELVVRADLEDGQGLPPLSEHLDRAHAIAGADIEVVEGSDPSETILRFRPRG